jgi:hypothetical protein
MNPNERSFYFAGDLAQKPEINRGAIQRTIHFSLLTVHCLSGIYRIISEQLIVNSR